MNTEKEIIELAKEIGYAVEASVSHGTSNKFGEITRTIILTKTYKGEAPCKQ